MNALASPLSDLSQEVNDLRFYLEHVLPWPQKGEDGCIALAWQTLGGNWSQKAVSSSNQAEVFVQQLAADNTVSGIFATQARMQGSVVHRVASQADHELTFKLDQ